MVYFEYLKKTSENKITFTIPVTDMQVKHVIDPLVDDILDLIFIQNGNLTFGVIIQNGNLTFGVIIQNRNLTFEVILQNGNLAFGVIRKNRNLTFRVIIQNGNLTFRIKYIKYLVRSMYDTSNDLIFRMF